MIGDNHKTIPFGWPHPPRDAGSAIVVGRIARDAGSAVVVSRIARDAGSATRDDNIPEFRHCCDMGGWPHPPRGVGNAVVVSRIARDAGKYITLSPSRLPRHRHKQSHPKMRRMAQGDGADNGGIESNPEKSGGPASAIIRVFLTESLKLDRA